MHHSANQRSDLLQKLLNGHDPYAGFDANRFRPDAQGWNSAHEFLRTTIELARPSAVLELGVWKGGSTISMAQEVQRLGLPTQIIAVDTWLGSWEHYEHPDTYGSLLKVNGYPSLYTTFLTNIVEAGVQDIVIPLPLDSANASFVVDRKGLRPDLIHIDAGHDYQAVLDDMNRWWPLLVPGGWLIADDYDPAPNDQRTVWPSVGKAIDDFLAITPHESFEAIPYKARFRKPS